MKKIPTLETLVSRRANPAAAADRLRRVQGVVETLRANGVIADGYRLVPPFRRSGSLRAIAQRVTVFKSSS